jgi:hypothetical protein
VDRVGETFFGLSLVGRVTLEFREVLSQVWVRYAMRHNQRSMKSCDREEM